MARKLNKENKKIKDDVVIDARDGKKWEEVDVNVESDTKLEDDLGIGTPFIVRRFTFAINPEMRKYKPTKQEIFNSHAKGIQTMLWKDGMRPIEGVSPRVIIGKNHYQIYIGAEPSLGNTLLEKTQTLSQIANGARNSKQV